MRAWLLAALLAVAGGARAATVTVGQAACSRNGCTVFTSTITGTNAVFTGTVTAGNFVGNGSGLTGIGSGFTGTGTAGRMTKFTGATALGNSNWLESAGNLSSTGSLTCSSATLSGDLSSGGQVSGSSLRSTGGVIINSGFPDGQIYFAQAGGTLTGDSGLTFVSATDDLSVGGRLFVGSGLTASSGTFVGEVRAATFNAVGTAYQVNSITVIDGSRNVTAVTVAGDGAALTALNASQLTTGTLPNARLDSSSATLQGNAFNAANKLVQLDGAAAYPAQSGAAITSLNASNLASGTVPNARLDSASVTLQGNLFNGASQLVKTNASGFVANANLDGSSITKQGNAFNGVSQLVQLDSSGFLPILNGAALTSLNASNLASGTVPNARLDSASATLQGNTFNAANKLVQLDSLTRLPAVDGSQLTGISPGIGGAGSGVAGKLPVWTGTATLAASNWAEAGGNLSSTGSLTASSGTFSGEVRASTFNAVGSEYQMNGVAVITSTRALIGASGTFSGDVGANSFKVASVAENQAGGLLKTDGSGNVSFPNSVSAGLSFRGADAGNITLLPGVGTTGGSVQIYGGGSPAGGIDTGGNFEIRAGTDATGGSGGAKIFGTGGANSTGGNLSLFGGKSVGGSLKGGSVSFTGGIGGIASGAGGDINLDGGPGADGANHGAVIFKTGTVERARVAKDGNFGVGTTVPLEKIHSTGRILADQGIQASSGTFSGEVRAATFNAVGTAYQVNSVTVIDSAGAHVGNGAQLTALNASQLTSGTVPNAQLDNTSVTLNGNTFNANSKLLKADSTGKVTFTETGTNLFFGAQTQSPFQLGAYLNLGFGTSGGGGGAIELFGGKVQSTNGSAGAVDIKAGTNLNGDQFGARLLLSPGINGSIVGNAQGGPVTLTGGDTTQGPGGPITVTAGGSTDNTSDGTGGTISLTAGDSTAAEGGSVIMDAGGGTLNGAIRMRVNGALKATIDPNGNFGIGITTATEKLDVVGYVKTSSGVKVGSEVAFSSVPVHVAGSVLITNLVSGTTFFAFTVPSALTLRTISATVQVAGIGGSGDTFRCNNDAGAGIEVTVAAAAAAGTVADSLSTSANIAKDARVSCHIESAAATRPMASVALGYVMQ